MRLFKKHSLVFPIATLILTGSAYSQIITTSAGNSTWDTPEAVTVDTAGNQYIPDYRNHCVYKVDRLGATSIVAGTEKSGGFVGDGGLATGAKLLPPQGVAVDSAGNIYISDTGNSRIRKVGINGIISTIAGRGSKHIQPKTSVKRRANTIRRLWEPAPSL